MTDLIFIMVIIWLMSGFYLVYIIRRDWPAIEKRAIEDEYIYRSIGFVPEVMKYMTFALVFLLGPVAVVVQASMDFRVWNQRRKINKSFNNIIAILDKLPPDDPGVIDMKDKIKKLNSVYNEECDEASAEI